MQASRATGAAPDHSARNFLRKTARSAHHPLPEPRLSLRSPAQPGEVSGTLGIWNLKSGACERRAAALALGGGIS
jgi:hypothetical protein